MTTFRDIYRGHREAAVAAFGTVRYSWGAEPGMSVSFGHELVRSWGALADSGIARIIAKYTFVPSGTHELIRLRDRFKLQAPLLLLGDEEGLVDDPGALWKLVSNLASELDAIDAARSSLNELGESFGEAALDIPRTVGAALGTALGSVAGVVGKAIEAPLLLVAVGVGVYLVAKGST